MVINKIKDICIILFAIILIISILLNIYFFNIIFNNIFLPTENVNIQYQTHIVVDDLMVTYNLFNPSNIKDILKILNSNNKYTYNESIRINVPHADLYDTFPQIIYKLENHEDFFELIVKNYKNTFIAKYQSAIKISGESFEYKAVFQSIYKVSSKDIKVVTFDKNIISNEKDIENIYDFLGKIKNELNSEYSTENLESQLSMLLQVKFKNSNIIEFTIYPAQKFIKQNNQIYKFESDDDFELFLLLFIQA